MLAHNVFFSIKNCTPQLREAVLADCQKYLTGHPGVLFFCCGTPSDLNRPVNDRDFDVGLHLIFEDRAAHDAYMVAPRHQEFVAKNTPNWQKVRVFDSDCEGAK